MRVRLALAGAALVACAPAPPADPTGEVTAMLTRSAAAWNRGDLDAFMSDYVPDSLTTFVAGGRVRYGFEWIRENYAPAFAPGAPRDSLRFEAVAARALSHGVLLATARFVLFDGDAVTASGPFTLVLVRQGADWKIIHDHTSRDE